MVFRLTLCAFTASQMLPATKAANSDREHAILRTYRIVQGGNALLHCENNINQGRAQISRASGTMGGGGMVDQNPYKSLIETPNWAPASPLVVTLFFDESDLGKCNITLLE